MTTAIGDMKERTLKSGPDPAYKFRSYLIQGERSEYLPSRLPENSQITIAHRLPVSCFGRHCVECLLWNQLALTMVHILSHSKPTANAEEFFKGGERQYAARLERALGASVVLQVDRGKL